MYTIEKLKQGKIAIHCPTESEAREVINTLRDMGAHKDEKDYQYARFHKDKTCVLISDSFRRPNTLVFDTIESKAEHGHTFISASEFLASQKPQQQEHWYEFAQSCEH